MAGSPRVSRRRLLLGGAVSAAALVSSGRAAAALPEEIPVDPPGQQRVPYAGAHQAGIATELQSFARFTAFTLRPGVARSDLIRLMKLWSDDIARLTQGIPALADPVAELASTPARLTATVGFGPGIFVAAKLQAMRPSWLRPLPAFAGDALQERWSGGDLLMQLCADDPVTLSHAHQVITTSAADFATIAWEQQGFHRAAGMSTKGAVGRNLMGFLDGMVNPKPDTVDFDKVVWDQGAPAWLAGGTGLVLRRIRLNLDTWASLSTDQREQVFGRRVSDGTPLSGATPSDKADLDAKDANGLSAIPTFSHIRLAAPVNDQERILRRPYNYDDGPTAAGDDKAGAAPTRRDTGLVFAAYCADPDRQFVPIQRRLAEHDLLNVWTTAVGSAVFAIPPGFSSDSYVGERLLG